MASGRTPDVWIGGRHSPPREAAGVRHRAARGEMIYVPSSSPIMQHWLFLHRVAIRVRDLAAN